MGTTPFNYYEKGYIGYISAVGFRVTLCTLTHPFEYAKFLIQIGHEPMPSYPTKTIFGKPARALPNIIKYVGFIKNTDGFLGLYRGYLPKITGKLISSAAAHHVSKHIKVTGDYNPSEDEVSDEMRLTHFRQTLLKDFVGKSVTIIVSQPFYVISCRAMAQFVGGEEVYGNVFSGIAEIYRSEGITGFFTGLVPRWLGEIASLLLSSVIIYGVNTYLIQDPEINSLGSTLIQYSCNALTYPFTVISACWTVNNCGLAAGQPPQMPIFDNWTHTWRYLHKINQHNRGSSTLFRYYPQAKQPWSF